MQSAFRCAPFLLTWTMSPCDGCLSVASQRRGGGAAPSSFPGTLSGTVNRSMHCRVPFEILLPSSRKKKWVNSRLAFLASTCTPSMVTQVHLDSSIHMGCDLMIAQAALEAGCSVYLHLFVGHEGSQEHEGEHMLSNKFPAKKKP